MGHLDTVARVRIAGWRKTAEMTQKELADKIGRNSVWISRYLDDSYDTDLDTLDRFATALGKTLGQLLGSVPNTDEGELLERFRALKPDRQKLALEMVRSWTPDVSWPLPARSPESSSATSKATSSKSNKRGNPPRS